MSFGFFAIKDQLCSSGSIYSRIESSMVELVNDNNFINQLWSKVPDVDKNRLMSTELRELGNISEKYNLALKNKINSNSGSDNIYNKINADLTKF